VAKQQTDFFDVRLFYSGFLTYRGFSAVLLVEMCTRMKYEQTFSLTQRMHLEVKKMYPVSSSLPAHMSMTTGDL
jgi:hypothetical protein